MYLPESTFFARRKKKWLFRKRASLSSFFRFVEIYFPSWEINFNMAGGGGGRIFFSSPFGIFLIRESLKLLIKRRKHNHQDQHKILRINILTAGLHFISSLRHKLLFATIFCP